MLLWIFIAFLTAAAVLAVLAPLGRAQRQASSAAHSSQVYRDQLDELERDRRDGRIGAAEAEAARAEIARRLIAVDREERAAVDQEARSLSAFPRRAVAVLALAGIPALSLGLYLMLGAPQLPGAPLAARLSVPTTPDDIELLIAKVEEHLAKNPEDGRGWEVIAPVYLRLQRAGEAAQAYRSAIRILGPSAPLQEGLGQAILGTQAGVVTAEAKDAFEQAVALDPATPVARFFLGVAAEQEGDHDAALARMQALLPETVAGTPLRVAVEEGLARLGAPGPSAADAAAAEAMPASERSAMVDSMVSGLAARLRDQPDDVEGWLRLIRSYVVLGRGDDAAAAAGAALAGVRDAASRERVEALIADLGVTPSEAAVP